MSSVFSAAALGRSTPIHWLRWILCITSWSGRAATRKRRSHGSSSERFSAVSSARRTCKPSCLPITSLALQRTRGSAMRRSHSCAKPSITVYRPAWALASRVTLISNRFTATLASTPSSPTPKSMPQQPPSSSKRERERDGNFDRSHSERTRAVLLRLSVTLLGTLNLLRDCQKLLFLFGFHRLVERTGLLPQGVHQCIKNGLQGLRAIAKYAFHALAIDGELADLTHAGHIEITACAPWLPYLHLGRVLVRANG